MYKSIETDKLNRKAMKGTARGSKDSRAWCVLVEGLCPDGE